jgi:hypothetical protein
MKRLVRRKLTMAGRVRDFTRTYPSTDASWTGVVSRLEELLTRAGELELVERQGRADRRTASATRRAVRDRIQADYLRHLVTTASVAFKDDPAVPKVYRLPRLNGPYRVFGATARAILTAAQPVRDRLVAAGLGETLLDELAAALAEFDAATEADAASRRAHMVARGELEELADQIGEQVKLLDGLMRPRIRREPALKEAWERISTLEGPDRASRTPVVGAIGPAPGNEMVTPEELPVEPSAGQGLLNPGSQDDDGSADTPAGGGDRNVG